MWVSIWQPKTMQSEQLVYIKPRGKGVCACMTVRIAVCRLCAYVLEYMCITNAFCVTRIYRSVSDVHCKICVNSGFDTSCFWAVQDLDALSSS